MIQQVIAILILLFFAFKLSREKKKNHITKNEFIFWLIFWLIGVLTIAFIKPIDKIVMSLGFSSSGINLVFYLAVLFLFYLIFRMRLKMVKIENDITELSRKITLK